jgi:hypothetical protein
MIEQGTLLHDYTLALLYTESVISDISPMTMETITLQHPPAGPRKERLEDPYLQSE